MIFEVTTPGYAPEEAVRGVWCVCVEGGGGTGFEGMRLRVWG